MSIHIGEVEDSEMIFEYHFISIENFYWSLLYIQEEFQGIADVEIISIEDNVGYIRIKFY